MRQVTIGICVKNAEKTIRKTLESIRNQDFPHENMELIVVVGNNETRDFVMKSISDIGITTSLFSDEGRGLGVARQTVVDNAHGKYIVWVDGDVVLSNDFIWRQVSFMNEHPDVSVAIGRYEHADLKGKFVANILSLYWSLLGIVYFGATICRTQAIKEVNGFDQRIKGASEDTDLVFRLILAGWKLAINPKAKFFHKQRETWASLVSRGIWYGYGGHFMGHKYEALIEVLYRLPPIYLGSGFRLSSEAYRRYRRKKSFLIPVARLFFSVGWCMGFILGNIQGYGHSVKNHEIEKERTMIAKRKVRKMLAIGGN